VEDTWACRKGAVGVVLVSTFAGAHVRDEVGSCDESGGVNDTHHNGRTALPINHRLIQPSAGRSKHAK